MANENQFIRGAGMLAVLKVLEGGELYGYAIVEALAKTKGEALHLGQATVYPMLYNLEAKGLVKARWDESGPRPRKYYSLTKAGKTRLAEDADGWSAITRAMASLGLERAAWLRFAAVACMACAALVLPAGPASAAVQQQEAVAENAADAYDRIHQRLTQLYDLAPDESREAFMYQGVIDESMQRWFEQARPLGREFIDATRRPYGRDLDYSQGFDLLLPHYSGQRQLARTARLLAHDAAQRGDRSAAIDYLCAQMALGRQAGSERVVIGSLVSMGIARLGVNSLDEMLDYGLIDRDGAERLAGSREGLAASMRAQMAASIEMESGILVQEVGRLAELDDAGRLARFSQLGINQPIASDAASVEKWKAQASSYNEATKAAVANTDPKAMRGAVEALAARVAAGEFGDFLKVFGADLSQALFRLEIVEAELARQDALLADIVSGKKKPEDFANAARLYQMAAKAAESLSAEQQGTIEALRLAPDKLTDADRREARRAIEALRARVIANVMQASSMSRCVFDQDSHDQTDLLPSMSEGLLGALRVALFDPLLPGERPEDAPSAVDACVAVISAIRHISTDNGLGRALVAQRVGRDVAQALVELDAKGALDAGARERLAKELALLKSDDPFGIRGAIDTERLRISRSAGLRHAAEDDKRAFSRSRLANLSPDSIAFLSAALSLDRAALKAAKCDCPFDGPILDVRPLFDIEAFEKALAQREKLQQRIDAAIEPRDGDAGTALRGMTLTKPVAVEERIAEARADFARLAALVEPKTTK
jgi:PadR family transcriptional regulator PadR